MEDILQHIDELEYNLAFAKLEERVGDHPGLIRFRKEFINRMDHSDVNFWERLKTFIQTIIFQDSRWYFRLCPNHVVIGIVTGGINKSLTFFYRFQQRIQNCLPVFYWHFRSATIISSQNPASAPYT